MKSRGVAVVYEAREILKNRTFVALQSKSLASSCGDMPIFASLHFTPTFSLLSPDVRTLSVSSNTDVGPETMNNILDYAILKIEDYEGIVNTQSYLFD